LTSEKARANTHWVESRFDRALQFRRLGLGDNNDQSGGPSCTSQPIFYIRYIMRTTLKLDNAPLQVTGAIDPRARSAFPFVAILQSELADTGRDRMVAPLVARSRMPSVSGRLTPIVKVLGVEHVLIVPRMAPVGIADLHGVKDQLVPYRNEIVAALDFLFLGL